MHLIQRTAYLFRDRKMKERMGGGGVGRGHRVALKREKKKKKTPKHQKQRAERRGEVRRAGGA